MSRGVVRSQHATTTSARSREVTYGSSGARGIHEKGDGENHQESVMGGGAGGNVGGAPPVAMQMPSRAADTRATTAMKAFLQLRPPIFKGEPDPLMAEDWLEQVTRALDTILVTKEELRVLFASYQLQGDALQWWKTVEESVAKKWEPFRKAFLDQYFTNTANEALRMEFINLVQGIASSGQTSRGGPICFGCHQLGYRVMDCPLIGQLRQSQQRVHTEEEQSGSYRIATIYSVSPGLEGCSSIYISIDFISVWIIGYKSAGSEDSGAGLCYDINSGTVGDSRAVGAAVGYLCRMRYFSCV
ncbi:hypothetical protein Acr_00g0041370 [Actinidia rufa]|uniref:Retrotransposon gag domain-containing protein n=1 Tax=Actinidia rufa TaxID=165716 RepID=A0A7J0DI85_9ERIC|nr:hypothetical protein Acr_00g0041370 [Actinidia rufa]